VPGYGQNKEVAIFFAVLWLGSGGRFFVRRAPCQEEEGGTMVDVPATVERALPEQYGGSHEVQHERFVVIFVVRSGLEI